ncbi:MULTISPECIES: hypothetical protein [Aerosakkonema]|uniref:hypothetical protein n=1 Tax=Aerosakkonema TaxID=1246629 RepID=UPI0035B6D014
MAIPSEIRTLIDRLNQELNQTETDTTRGLTQVRAALSRFPENVIMIQFFAYLNDVLLFVDICRRRIDSILERITPNDVAYTEIQEAGEDLGTLLGRVLETKIEVERIINRL